MRLNNDDVLYIESMGDYVRFVTNDRKYVVHNTIKNLEEKMNRQAFMKIHRSYIVNIQKVDNIRENGLFIKGYRTAYQQGPPGRGNSTDQYHLKRLSASFRSKNRRNSARYRINYNPAFLLTIFVSSLMIATISRS